MRKITGLALIGLGFYWGVSSLAPLQAAAQFTTWAALVDAAWYVAFIVGGVASSCAGVAVLVGFPRFACTHNPSRTSTAAVCSPSRANTITGMYTTDGPRGTETLEPAAVEERQPMTRTHTPVRMPAAAPAPTPAPAVMPGIYVPNWPVKTKG